jgi:hypothetical protein
MQCFKSLFLIGLSLMVLLIGQSCSPRVKSFEYASKFYRIELTDTVPFVKYFSVDALGNGKLTHNPIQWKKSMEADAYELSKVSDSVVEIYKKGESGKALWVFNFGENKFSVTSNYSGDNAAKGIEFRFDKQKNHATLLGEMTARNKTLLPAVLHLPDMGTFQVRADRKEVTVDFDASRLPGENFISITLPPAKAQQSSVRYTFTAKSIYPQFPGVEEEKFAGFRRNYLNLFQINARLHVIANNSCASPCSFTLFLSSMMALKTPPLVDSLTALDLLRLSVERYLNGLKTYGMNGYDRSWEGKGKEVDLKKARPYDALDTYPSLVISACNYIRGSKDVKWAGLHYAKIKEWMDIQMKRDYNHNGLVEYELRGNSGSWDGVVRPANWWDTIGFGHEDAFCNALTYDALNLMVTTAQMLGKNEDVHYYRLLAEKLKHAYFRTFYNPATGVLAGWKSKDGKLHDYYFLFVNSMAVYYNLVPEEKIKDVMTVIWNKMQEVGFNDFTLGIPGNLIPVRKEDYTTRSPRYGYCEKDDGSDAFQRYENGGASINWSYYTLKAFKKAGLSEQLSKIREGILKGIDEGAFQGYCGNGGMTRDWKTWKGECWGYEGYLCDGYLVLLALNPEDE